MAKAPSSRAGGGGPQKPQLAAGGASGGAPVPPRAKAKGLQPQRTRRNVREYYLTKRELNGLATLNALTSLLFSISGFLLALALDAQKDLVTTVNIAAAAKDYLEQVRLACGLGCAFMFIAGASSFVWGWNEVRQIESEHENV